MSTPSARALRKAQEIRHVRRAIRFYEHKKKKTAQENDLRRENKLYRQSVLSSKHTAQERAKTALKNAKVDWELGDLRPNRAIGSKHDKYGLFGDRETYFPDAPEHWVEPKKNQKILPKALPDTIRWNFAPIQQDDRVLIMKGQDKGKVGVVSHVSPKKNALAIKDLNRVSPHKTSQVRTNLT